MVDLMDGTTEAAPEYTSGDAAKVLTVAAGGSGLEWANAVSSSGPRIWSCYFDNTAPSSSAQAAFNHDGSWSVDFATNEKDTKLDKFGSNSIEVGTSLGSYANGEFTVSETGTYKVSWDITVGAANFTGAEARASDIAMLRHTGASGNGADTDEVLRRSARQFKYNDEGNSTPADDGMVSYSHSSLVSLTAGDNLFLYLAGGGDTTNYQAHIGSWMIEKVG